MDCSPPGSSVYGILQVRILEWVAISFSRGFSQRRDQICVPCLAGKFFTTEPPGKPKERAANILKWENKERRGIRTASWSWKLRQWGGIMLVLVSELWPKTKIPEKGPLVSDSRYDESASGVIKNCNLTQLRLGKEVLEVTALAGIMLTRTTSRYKAHRR